MVYAIDPLFSGFDSKYRTRVYFALGINGQVKIGLTGRPNGRRGGEMHFTELCSVPGDKSIESRYHAEYAAERLGRSEWFVLSDRLLLSILIMCVQQGRHRSTEILKGIIQARLEGQAAA